VAVFSRLCAMLCFVDSSVGLKNSEHFWGLNSLTAAPALNTTLTGELNALA